MILVSVSSSVNWAQSYLLEGQGPEYVSVCTYMGSSCPALPCPWLRWETSARVILLPSLLSSSPHWLLGFTEGPWSLKDSAFPGFFVLDLSPHRKSALCHTLSSCPARRACGCLASCAHDWLRMRAGAARQEPSLRKPYIQAPSSTHYQQS